MGEIVDTHKPINVVKLASFVFQAMRHKAPRLRQKIKEMLEEMDPELDLKGEFLYKVVAGLMVRIPEWEPAIAERDYLARRYISNVIKGPWPMAEPTLAKNPDDAVEYICWHKKARFPEAEPYLLDEVIHGRYFKEDNDAREDWFEDLSGCIYEYIPEWPELEEFLKDGGWFKQPYRKLFLAYTFSHAQPLPWFEKDLLENTKKFTNGSWFYVSPKGGQIELLRLPRTITRYLYNSYPDWDSFINANDDLADLLVDTRYPFEREFYGFENGEHKPGRFK